ncbi:hypothetical protein FQA39_LY15329 [Lamprigera yunnana]|nr:hypothetical protein FQA39_LY15329 [Lamprigera yunnana]
MSRNIITITKWVPLENEENQLVFQECGRLRVLTRNLLELLGKFLKDFQFKNRRKSYHSMSEKESIIENLEVILEMAESLKLKYYEIFEKLNIFRPTITKVKVKLWKDILWKMKLMISYLLRQLINEIVFLFVHYGEKLLCLTFRLSNVYNHYLNMDAKFKLNTTSTICSNTCPYLMYPMRKVSITKLLQSLAQNRAELCCHKLIDCLLDTYKLYETHEDDDGSDNSSIEIYRAITKHMSPPLLNNVQDEKIKIEQIANDIDNFASMEELVKYEEQNVLDLLDVAIKIAPDMLGDSIKKSKIAGEMKLNPKATTKVLDYYQQILWGEVGNFLEHIILWWGALPLAERPPHSSQHLREWITQFLPTIEIPNFILSALINLADSLGMYITSTSWDQHFRLVLVASQAPLNQETGRTFNDMLQNLVLLSNQCETTSDWILGAPLEDLPLVEQIPILHRLGNIYRHYLYIVIQEILDHSIHMTRLWAINETKRIANNWDVKKFFIITHCDIINCLTQLKYLNLNDHSAEIEKSGFGAHVEVCVNMRAKLASEVSINYEKLKLAQKQCIDTLAKVCRMVSLANLQMIFPKNNYYKRNSFSSPKKASNYVAKYLDNILTPVLDATQDHNICNMILKIMCESWLDHIYLNKMKFSQYGAYQLLMDFASVRTWLLNCSIMTQSIRKEMLKNEVLRRCEGVGKLLLRSPGEQLKMNDKVKSDQNESPKSDSTELMPPEMYVPNQEQWLELRAHKGRTIFNTSICCANTTVQPR